MMRAWIRKLLRVALIPLGSRSWKKSQFLTNKKEEAGRIPGWESFLFVMLVKETGLLMMEDQT
jgi:hypothetical protein